MINNTLIIRSTSTDPWYNLAIEEILLNTVGENQCILYLWQNKNTIVIGKNQNPWKECRTKKLENEEGKLARRLSGGGTVYHDLGNLNFTFLLNRSNYDLGRQVGVILSAVRQLGIPAEMIGRNDLIADGRKFSGNAFCFKKENAYHHGTILVSSDLDKLTSYLQVSSEKIKSKGIDSVRSRVVNLTEFCPDITIERVVQAFSKEFQATYCEAAAIKTTESMNQEEILKLYSKYASWEWRYGETPVFDVEFSTRFNWGCIDLGLKLNKGVVTKAWLYSDCLDNDFIGTIRDSLEGAFLDMQTLADRVGSISVDNQRQQMKEDIEQWIISKRL